MKISPALIPLLAVVCCGCALPAGAASVTNGLVVYLNFDNNLNAQAGTTNNGSLYTGGATSGPRYTRGHDRFRRHLCQYLRPRPAQ